MLLKYYIAICIEFKWGLEHEFNKTAETNI